jgi:hypothetical protein
MSDSKKTMTLNLTEREMELTFRHILKRLFNELNPPARHGQSSSTHNTSKEPVVTTVVTPGRGEHSSPCWTRIVFASVLVKLRLAA